MKHLLTFLLAVAVGCGGDGGGSVGSHDEAADEVAKAFKEVGEIVDTIKDPASAEAAKPKLDALAKRLEGITASVEKLGLPSDEQLQRTEPKMHAALSALSEKTLAHLDRVIENPKIGEALGHSLMAVQKHIPKLRVILGG